MLPPVTRLFKVNPPVYFLKMAKVPIVLICKRVTVTGMGRYQHLVPLLNIAHVDRNLKWAKFSYIKLFTQLNFALEVFQILHLIYVYGLSVWLTLVRFNYH
jgi:hypothetical protein